MSLTSKERIDRLMDRKPIDRVGIYEHFWPECLEKWQGLGLLGPEEDPGEHFGHDMFRSHPLNLMADPEAGEVIVEETEETKLVRNGNGALLRYWKHHSGTPEHVDFEVTERRGWEEKIRPRLLDESLFERRIDFEGYRAVREKTRRDDTYMVTTAVNVFELMHPVCGHEYMLMGMALDPEWVQDMCTVYAETTIRLLEILFEREGLPDGMWFYEDMGFKHKPFMSPAMYKDIVWPAHKRTFDFAHSKGLKVYVHSCGFVEPLVPGLIEAGMDCLQAIEVKAGMDLLELKKKYGDRISLCGGLDIRILETNDKDKVREYLESMLPAAARDGGFILHTDHSISAAVEYDTYKYFVEQGARIGSY